MDETGGITFTIDQLAERADVSRRTIFNHFASIEDIVTVVCSEVLGALFDNFVTAAAEVPIGEDSFPSMFDEIAHTLRATDLVTPMAYLTRCLGDQDEKPPWRAVSSWQAALLLRAITDVSERLSAEIARRHPRADLLDIHILVGSLMSGVIVLHRHWFAETGAVDDEPSRQVWAALMDRLIRAVGDGYGTSEAAVPSG